jgi:hypothetical protein
VVDLAAHGLPSPYRLDGRAAGAIQPSAPCRGLGLDCHFCHSGVETAANAGLPPTYTCMTCPSQIWTNASLLAPVRRSLADNQPIAWHRINDLPDYVYFDHAIHIAKASATRVVTVMCGQCRGCRRRRPSPWASASIATAILLRISQDIPPGCLVTL